ncbi:MAG: histidine kinase N-terminal 7TM domain-containing protein [Deltaproteobacteria bacterium]|nr:histidine kinase N-terminal 7TM domain-containing protein [Deltaproteobacteria bacterium]
MFYYSHYLILPFFSTLISFALCWYIFRHRRETLAQPVLSIIMILTLWAFVFTLQTAATELWLKLQLFKIGTTCAALLGPFTLSLALEASGFGHWKTKRLLQLVLLVPALTIIAIWTNELHNLTCYSTAVIRSGPLLVMGFKSGPLYNLHIIYTMLLYALAQALMLAGLIREAGIDRRRLALLLAGTLVPFTVHLFRITPLKGFNFVPSVFWLSTLCYFLAIFRYRLLTIVPIARSVLFENLGHPVLILDARSRLIDSNRSARKLFDSGETSEETATLDAVKQRFPEFNAFISNFPPTAFKQQIQDSVDQRRGWMVSIVPLEHHGKYLGRIIEFHDISDLKQAEMATRAAMTAAEEASSAKSRFLAMVSHEMRTPLHAMSGAAELLEELAQMQEQRRSIDLFRKSCATLQHLVEDLLDLSTIEAERLKLTPAPFGLVEMMNHIHDLFAPRFAQKQIEFTIYVAEGLPPAVNGDRRRVVQVLTNLIENALKFTSSGAVTVTVEQPANGEGMIRFMVTDSGAGIRADRRSEIFSPFVSLIPQPGSAGLGLTIASRLVELMGGELTVSSASGKGSIFCFTIELAPVDVSSLDDKYACLPQTLPSLRILAVDDIPDNLKLLSFYFAGTPFCLTPCLQAADALELLEAVTFDCMLTDICMPNIDGDTLIKTIREQENRRGPGTARMPIIAISAAAFADDIQNALDAGCDEYLSRPVGRRELIRSILRLTHHESSEIPGEETAVPITGGMLDRVSQRIAACRDEVADACKRGDMECAIRAGHSIKGLGMAFNLPEVERMGAGIEKASREGDSEGVMELVK